MKEIYAILSPATGDIRYIGFARNSGNRVAGHWSQAGNLNEGRPIYAWLRQWKECPPFRILAIVEDSEALIFEATAIAAARRAFPGRLLNIRPKPPKDSPEWLTWQEFVMRQVSDRAEPGYSWLPISPGRKVAKVSP